MIVKLTYKLMLIIIVSYAHFHWILNILLISFRENPLTGRSQNPLTAAIDGLERSPAGGWVTSAPRKITGSWNTGGLHRKKIQLAITNGLGKHINKGI